MVYAREELVEGLRVRLNVTNYSVAADLGKQLFDGKSCLVKPRHANLVSGKRLARGRVDDRGHLAGGRIIRAVGIQQGREITVEICDSGECRRVRARIVEDRALIAGEKERLVTLDRPADSAAELIALELVYGAGKVV